MVALARASSNAMSATSWPSSAAYVRRATPGEPAGTVKSVMPSGVRAETMNCVALRAPSTRIFEPLMVHEAPLREAVVDTRPGS